MTTLGRSPLVLVASGALRDVVQIVVAFVPFLLGLVAGLIVRLALLVLAAVVWMIAAFEDGYTAGRGKR